MSSLRHPSLLLAAASLLGGCMAVGPAFSTWQVDGGATDATVRYEGIPVHTGQIIVSEQGSANSMFLSLLVAENHPYVHSGIIVVENGSPWVYEANGRMQPSLGSSPLTHHVTGGMRRIGLGTFLAQNRFIAIYDPPPGTDAELIGRFAQDSYMAGLPFDPYFDRSDPSKVYCSEFTALALAAGGAPPPRTSPMNANASVGVILDWLEITTPDIIPPASLIANATRVGVFSRRDSPAQMEAYFAVKAELHRRFTPDQKLGNVLHFSPVRGLAYQPEVEAFMAAANKAAAGWADLSPAEIDDGVRALANERLGPFDASRVAQRTAGAEDVVIAGVPH
ncbi:MAG: hypothetical protein JNK40_14210 [Chromatiales bacterium]|nr:hypothetical protein [Chromatiales bacterium]